MGRTTTTFALHPFGEGERVHYRSLEELDASLEEGYLELESIRDSDLFHYVIRKVGKGDYRLAGGTAGDTPAFVVKEGSLADLVEKRDLDLHAYRWYPTRQVKREDHWLLDSMAEPPDLGKRLSTLIQQLDPPNFMLDQPYSREKTGKIWP